jgi:hypothetical protein
MATIDTTSLAAIVQQCFDLSQDATLSDDQRQAYYNLGLHARSELADAYAATFPDTDARIGLLNQQLADLNAQIKSEQDVEASFSQNVKNITSALNVLDQLILLLPK